VVSTASVDFGPECSRSFATMTGIGLGVAAIFGMWAALQFLYGTAVLVEGSRSEVSDYVGWLALANRVAEGNLFPILTAADPKAMGFGPFPYLSIWFEGGLIAAFGHAWAKFIGLAILPVISFLLMVAIFRRYVSLPWAIALTSVALVSFSGLPFREFLMGLLVGEGWRDLGIPELPEILRQPFPALSLPIFLAVFLISTQKRHLDARFLSVATALWAIQSQTHLVYALVGLGFWFASFPIRIYRQVAAISRQRLALIVLAQALLALAVLSPAIYGFLSTETETLGVLEGQDRFGLGFHLTYFVLPTALLGIAYAVNRVDPFEIWIKFWPVFVLMGVEIFLINMPRLFGVGIEPQVVFERIGMLFLHFYYFVPAIYYFERPVMTYRRGQESGIWASRLRAALAWCFGPAIRWFLPALVVALSFFALSSALSSYDRQKNFRAPGAQAVGVEVEALAKGLSAGQVVLSDNITTNLALSGTTRFASVWADRFSNRIGVQDALSRLAFHARLYGWSEDEFVAFMAPGAMQSDDPKTRIALTGSDASRSGIGFWLVYHRQSASAERRTIQEQNARSAYRAVSIDAALTEYRVERIFSKSDLHGRLSYDRAEKVGSGFLYHLNPPTSRETRR